MGGSEGSGELKKKSWINVVSFVLIIKSFQEFESVIIYSKVGKGIYYL